MAHVNSLDSVTLKLLYGGSFTRNESGMVYTGRMCRAAAIDIDEFCWFTIVEEAEKCGNYKRDVDAIFFKNSEGELERVVDDKGAKIMCKIAVSQRVVECYMVSAGFLVNLMHLIEGNVKESNLTSLVKCSKKLTPRRKAGIRYPSQKQGPLQKNTEKSNSTSHTVIKEPHSETLNSTPPKTSQKESQASTILQRKSPRFTPKNLEFDTPECTFDFNDITINDAFNTYEEESDLATHSTAAVVKEDSKEEGEPDYEPDCEELSDDEGSDVEARELIENEAEENLLEQDILYDGISDDEELQEARDKVKEWNVNALKIVKQLEVEVASTLLPGQEPAVTGAESSGSKEGCESDYDKSGDEVDTPGESDDDAVPGKRRKTSIPVVNEHSDFTKLKWCVGIRFPTREFFRDCVTRYSIAQGRNCTFVVSDKSRGRRLGVRCKKDCPFKLYGSWDNTQACFLVKTVKNTHNCQRTMESNRQMKSTWLAKQFLDVFKAKPHWPAADIIETVRRAYKIMIKKGFAYKVKYYAHKLLHGSMKEHYSKLGSYLSVLEQEYPNTNPTTQVSSNQI